MSQDYASFIASAYVGPIFELIERMSQSPPNEVHASVHDYGHAVSAIALTVLFLESFLNISKHLNGSQERSVRSYYRKTFPGSPHQEELLELFVIRDIIAHNHVWTGRIDPMTMTWITVDLMPGYGGIAFRNVVDVRQRVTKKLGLNVVPTRVGYRDVRIVVKTVAAILRDLQACHLAAPGGYYLGPGGFGLVRFRGQPTLSSRQLTRSNPSQPVTPAFEAVVR